MFVFFCNMSHTRTPRTPPRALLHTAEPRLDADPHKSTLGAIEPGLAAMSKLSNDDLHDIIHAGLDVLLDIDSDDNEFPGKIHAVDEGTYMKHKAQRRTQDS